MYERSAVHTHVLQWQNFAKVILKGKWKYAHHAQVLVLNLLSLKCHCTLINDHTEREVRNQRMSVKGEQIQIHWLTVSEQQLTTSALRKEGVGPRELLGPPQAGQLRKQSTQTEF